MDHTHSHPAAPSQGSAATPHAHAHDGHDLKRDIKKYWLVFVALLVGTVLTVMMWKVHFDSLAVTITIALFIATIKAALVAGFFMHLISERKAIYAVLLATVFFFAAMMYSFTKKDGTPILAAIVLSSLLSCPKYI